MKKLTDITIASIVGFLILVAGMTRFHHHLSDDKICFCLDDLLSAECSHHHANHDEPVAPFGSQSETSCPLHIDLFKISENHNYIHISDNFCCDYHCDICSPEIYAPEHGAINLLFLPLLPFLERGGHDSALPRRGPPAFIA